MFSQPPDLQLSDKILLMLIALRNMVLRREMRYKKKRTRQKTPPNCISSTSFSSSNFTNLGENLQQKTPCTQLKLLKSQTQPISSQECKVYSKENKNANVWAEGMSSDVDVGSATQPKREQFPLTDDAMWKVWGISDQSAAGPSIFGDLGEGSVTEIQLMHQKPPDVLNNSQVTAGFQHSRLCYPKKTPGV